MAMTGHVVGQRRLGTGASRSDSCLEPAKAEESGDVGDKSYYGNTYSIAS